MFVDVSNNQFKKMENTTNKKVSYSIKKLLKQLYKKLKSKTLANLQNLENAKKAESLQSLESLENNRSDNIQYDCASLEFCEKERLNEQLSTEQSFELEDFECSDIITTSPVHFVSTEQGTFFWSASSDIPADNDLAEPMGCSTNNQLACMQYRWTQAEI